MTLPILTGTCEVCWQSWPADIQRADGMTKPVPMLDGRIAQYWTNGEPGLAQERYVAWHWAEVCNPCLSARNR